MLRFITCGSVDDGKSTLIGRLLYESQAGRSRTTSPRCEADSKRVGTQGGDLDFALLRRRPGGRARAGHHDRRRLPLLLHRASASSSSPTRRATSSTRATWSPARRPPTLAVILVDARKGVLAQTRRHSYLVSLLGIRHVVLAVNKLDLVDYAEEVFDAIEAEYRRSPPEIGLDDVVCIPISALQGDNIIEPSADTPWYDGPTLLEHLETVDDRRRRRRPAVPHAGAVGQPARTSTSAASRGRIVGGTRAAGRRGAGPARRARPRRSTRIVTFDGDLDEAVAGQSVTLTLADEIDVSRGDVLAAADDPAARRRPVRGRHRVDGRRTRCCPAAPTC